MTNNTLPLIDKDTNKRLSRQFDGKTDNFIDKREQNFYQKMLKAYCKGFTRFVFGRDSQNNPTYLEVE